MRPSVRQFIVNATLLVAASAASLAGCCPMHWTPVDEDANLYKHPAKSSPTTGPQSTMPAQPAMPPATPASQK